MFADSLAHQGDNICDVLLPVCEPALDWPMSSLILLWIYIPPDSGSCLGDNYSYGEVDKIIPMTYFLMRHEKRLLYNHSALWMFVLSEKLYKKQGSQACYLA